MEQNTNGTNYNGSKIQMQQNANAPEYKWTKSDCQNTNVTKYKMEKYKI